MTDHRYTGVIYAPDPLRENEQDAMRVLNLIVAEFESDPMSVQCFDLRVVQRAKDVITKRKAWETLGELPPLLTRGARA